MHFSFLLIVFCVSSPTGNTPLHLAMDSAHAAAAVLLINAGADRTRVRAQFISFEREWSDTYGYHSSGKPRWRDSRDNAWSRRTGAETRAAICDRPLWKAVIHRTTIGHRAFPREMKVDSCNAQVKLCTIIFRPRVLLSQVRLPWPAHTVTTYPVSRPF